MAIKATIRIDDDRWAKHPYEVCFDDFECDEQYGRTFLDSREDCHRIIEEAKSAGYDIDSYITEEIY